MALFSGKNKNGHAQVEVPTLISKGCLIKGYIKATVLVRIDGNLKGDILTEGLIVGESGLIEGNIETEEIIVFGTVRGNIKADSIEIKGTGKIYGEMSTNNLQIEKGAIYNGVLSMDPLKNESVKQLDQNGRLVISQVSAQ